MKLAGIEEGNEEEEGDGVMEGIDCDIGAEQDVDMAH